MGGASLTKILVPLNNCPLISFAALFASFAFASVTIAIQRYNCNVNQTACTKCVVQNLLCRLRSSCLQPDVNSVVSANKHKINGLNS